MIDFRLNEYSKRKTIEQDDRIRIAYVIDFIADQNGLTGGTERQLIQLINNIDQFRFKPILICLREFIKNPYWNTVKCEKHVLHVYSLASVHGMKAFFSFAIFLRKHPVDIVQTYFHDATLFGILAARFAGTKKTISSRRDLGFWHNKRLLRNISFVNMFTDRILANCMAVKNEVAANEHVRSDKVDIIHNGMDLEAFYREPVVDLRSEFPEIHNGCRIIGMVANYNREVKRADLFIKAAAEVVKHHNDVTFLLIGGGMLENELRNLISQLGVQDRVILGGKKDPAIPYIKAFDIGVLTSDTEGFSNVLLEYMATGIPVVATDVGGNRELIQNQELGLLVPRDDHMAIASAIIHLLNDRVKCKRIGSNARRHIKEHFSWSYKIKEVESYYEQLVGRRCLVEYGSPGRIKEGTGK